MKIAYIGEYHPTNGTYYRQRITVNKNEYDYINQKLTERYKRTQTDVRENHIMTGEQMNALYYQKPLDLTERNGNKIYLKLDQLYLIWSLFPGNKRFTNNNTILMIK